MTEDQALQLEFKLQSIEQSIDLWQAGEPHSRAIRVAAREMQKMIDAQLEPAKRSIVDAAAVCNRLFLRWKSDGAVEVSAAAHVCRSDILLITPSIVIDKEVPNFAVILREIESLADIWLSGASQADIIRVHVNQVRRWLTSHGGPVLGDPSWRALVKAASICNDLAVGYTQEGSTDKATVAWECFAAVMAMADERMKSLTEQFGT